jgi:uncharacterized protein (TIGR02186 family)
MLGLFAAGHAAAEPSAGSLGLASPMIADISQNDVAIYSNFNGTQLLIFGARNTPGDLAVVVRGPEGKIIVRRKERIAGMWMHVEQHKYLGVPLFYAYASTRPLDEISDTQILPKSLEIGEQPANLTHSENSSDMFDAALRRSLIKKRWWQLPFGGISYFGDSLFKARINLPDTLPGGTYTAEVYLFDQGKLRAAQTIPLHVYKDGIEARLYDSAQKHGLLYGIIAVAMALLGGWLAHRLFHR